MKKILVFLCLLVIGGCSYYKDTKVTITKEQQDNIAVRILRYYDIQEIEFTQFTQDKMTGSLLLSIKVNGDEQLQTTLGLDPRTSLDKKHGWILLSPLNKFEQFERALEMDEYSSVDLKDFKIKYIGE